MISIHTNSVRHDDTLGSPVIADDPGGRKHPRGIDKPRDGLGLPPDGRDLEREHAARAQVPPRPPDDWTAHAQPVGSPIEPDRRLAPPALPRKAPDFPRPDTTGAGPRRAAR